MIFKLFSTAELFVLFIKIWFVIIFSSFFPYVHINTPTWVHVHVHAQAHIWICTNDVFLSTSTNWMFCQAQCKMKMLDLLLRIIKDFKMATKKELNQKWHFSERESQCDCTDPTSIKQVRLFTFSTGKQCYLHKYLAFIFIFFLLNLFWMRWENGNKIIITAINLTLVQL